jgi:uncharacterized protein (DUF1684 family)
MSRRSVRRAARQSAAEAGPARVLVDVPADADPNHHLWKNGRRWWIAFTVHQDHRQERIRFSLGTPDVALARRRRDALLALFAQAEALRVSLRFQPRRDAAGRAA